MTHADDHGTHGGHAGPGGQGTHAGHGGHALTEHDQHAALDDLLDLDGEVLADYWTAALDWVRDAAAADAPARLADIGAGTGTGALGLARRFPAAAVTAVDISAEALRRVADKAAGLGLRTQVSVVEADLDAGWPDLGPLDLTWASMSLHHLADPAGALRHLLGITRPGGLIAVAEFREPVRFLPDDLGGGLGSGLEDRAMAAHGTALAEEMPTLGSAWAPRLAAAGWQVSAERDFPIDLDPPSHPRAGQYARAWFTRLAQGLGDSLEPEDRATLAALLEDDGPQSLLHRKDLHIHGIRTVTLGRRG
jgi:SAM-dependent methyltransferase